MKPSALMPKGTWDGKSYPEPTSVECTSLGADKLLLLFLQQAYAVGSSFEGAHYYIMPPLSIAYPIIEAFRRPSSSIGPQPPGFAVV